MKSTDNFKKVIQAHLEGVAADDPLFAETLKKENKNIDDCINYILNTVQKSGCNGFENEEIFGMAIHYYDEDDIKVGGKVTNVNIITNHKIELSPEEIAAAEATARQQALDEVIAAKKEQLKKKASKKALTAEDSQATLFDTL